MKRRHPRIGSYVKSTLQPGEAVYAVGQQHWAALLPAICLTAIAGAVLLRFRMVADEGFFPPWLWSLLSLVTIWPAVSAVLEFLTTETAVTDRRVLRKTGLFSRHADEISISKVETVKISQGALGRLVDYGTVTVFGTGGHGLEIKGIHQPMEFRKALHGVMAM